MVAESKNHWLSGERIYQDLLRRGKGRNVHFHRLSMGGAIPLAGGEVPADAVVFREDHAPDQRIRPEHAEELGRNRCGLDVLGLAVGEEDQRLAP